MAEEVILRAEPISKSFGGVKALQSVSFELEEGGILSVVGENGAGKSTSTKITARALKDDRGEIYFEGKKLSLNSPLDAVKTGIFIVYREPNIFADMSVLENTLMDNEVVNLNETIQWTKMYEETVGTLRLVGLNGNALRLTMGELSIGSQQLALIAKGIYKKCRILILDEPTSVLSHGEPKKLFEITADLKSRGVNIMYIGHRIPKILQISDNIIVLGGGCLTGTLPPREADEESIITAMSGREINTSVYQTREIKDDTILEVRNLGYRDQHQDITFSLKLGEILGMYGLVRSDRSETARAIFGETKAETGNIIFEGKDAIRTGISGAIEKNMFYIPEDRRAQGLSDIHSIRDSMNASFLDGFSNKFSSIRKKEGRKAVQNNAEKYNTKTPSQDLSVNNLSGGDQQKVLLCQWPIRKPRVLILDEPTKGIDVATKAEIRKYIMELATEGVAILVMSSDLPEIVGISGRILTLHEGTITAEFDRETVTGEKILRSALNLSDQSLGVHSEKI